MFLLLLTAQAAAVTVTLTANGNWTAPAGVTSVTVEAWGGGGGGGSARTNNNTRGGGGGGGGYSKRINVAVTPGNLYAVTVGAAGAGGTAGGAAATAGGNSTFAATTVVANGGAAGGAGTAAGGGGTGGAGGVAGTGDAGSIFAGGNGSAGVGAAGGAGGGGAGSGGVGGNASGSTAGTGTATGGGNGGAGLAAQGAGNVGLIRGGGGGGGFRTAANQAGGAGFRGEVWVTYTPATVIATGADPAATTIAPGAAATDVDLFTFQTSNGTDTITSITVNLSTASGIGLLAITNNANTVLGSTASPVAGANVIALGTNITATTTATTYKVRVTPLSHAAMLTVPGGSYDITAPVTNWVGTNAQVGSDTNANALTIDNLSPAGATATSGTPGNANVTLNWTTSASADFNTTSGSVLLRWTSASAGAEVPAEGTTYAAGNTIGTAFVACVISSAASTALARINGTGGSAGCNTTALTNGTDYTYKIFQKDTNGNYDTGVLIGTFRPSLTTTLATGADPAAATIAPGAAATDADLFTFQTNVGTETITSITLNLSTNSGIGLLAITNNANTVLGSTASPVAGTNVIPLGTNITATTTATTYKVRVTPLSHAAMPAPPGGSYDINATVTAWAGTNTIHAGSDTDNNALT
ncbi:MAG: hypothetical protein NTY41_00295, partial [Proteobacteria bacterium]|nr:hypothetical protein [Pseudomonadota bacterium]